MAKARTLAVGFAAIASAGVIGGVTALALVGQAQPSQPPQQERIVQQVADTEVVESTPEAPPSGSPTPSPKSVPSPTKTTATKSSGGGVKTTTTESDPEPTETATGSADRKPDPDPQPLPTLDPGKQPPIGS
ncbi:MAG TPA: hypothetical protein VFX60_13015 [Micromonospora sp.]|nr:hypothetical protein [Micromonospora sp.]